MTESPVSHQERQGFLCGYRILSHNIYKIPQIAELITLIPPFYPDSIVDKRILIASHLL
jgi:hypothetical protein